MKSPRTPSIKSTGRHTVSRDPALRIEESTPSHVVKFLPYPKSTEPTPLELCWIDKSTGRASHDDIKLKDAKMVSLYTQCLL